MTALCYYLFINKSILKSIRQNILYSKSVWEVLVNIIYCSIFLIVIPVSYSQALGYLHNWIIMSLVGSGAVENKVIQLMLACIFIIFFIEIVGLFIITVWGIVNLAVTIKKRYFLKYNQNADL